MVRLFIRQAELEDAEQIARLHVASWKVAYGGFMPPKQMAWISEVREVRRATDLISNPETPYLVAACGEEIVGFLVYGPPGDECDPESTRYARAAVLRAQRICARVRDGEDVPADRRGLSDRAVSEKTLAVAHLCYASCVLEQFRDGCCAL
jgi:hypothetical protein